MRTIKFRGKRIDGDGWIHGSYYQGNNLGVISHVIIRYDRLSGEDVFYEVNPETVGQYTGLKDSNGKEIFEGDIAHREFPALNTENIFSIRDNDFTEIEETGIVYYLVSESGFYVKDEDNEQIHRLTDRSPRWKVIGNIHDNPEFI